MISSLIEQRVSTLAAKIASDSVASYADAYLEHSRYPGPVISILGARKRGRSNLFSFLTGTEIPEEDGGICAACGAAWNGIIWRALPLRRGFEHRQTEIPANVMVIDSPAFDVPAASESIDRVLRISDLVIMAVQVTQPAGMDEVRFATEQLQGKPAILVVTKTDLADDEELAEAIEAIMGAYAGVLWREVLVAGTNMPEEGRCGLQSFTKWWSDQGIACAVESRNAVLQALWDKWIERARIEIASKLEPLQADIDRLHSKLATNSGIQRATELRRIIHHRLADIVAQATNLYQSQAPHLDAKIDRWIDQMLPEISPDKPFDRERMQESLRALFVEWDEKSRSYVREQLGSTAEMLQLDCQKFATQVVDLCAEFIEVRKEVTPFNVSYGGDEALLEITLPELSLTTEHSLWSSLVPLTYGAGTASLLMHLVPVAFPIAAAAGVLAWLCGRGAKSESDRRMLRNDFEQAVRKQARLIRHDLQERLREDWQEFERRVETELSPYDRRLSILARAEEASDDDSREHYQQLIDERRRLESLQDELDKLVSSVRKELQVERSHQS